MDPQIAEIGALGLERLGTDRRRERREAHAVLATCPPWPEGKPEEGERGVLVLTPTVAVLPIDDPRLVGMKPKPHLFHPRSDPGKHILSLPPGLAVHDSIVGVAFKWAAREVPGNPP